MSGHDCTIHAQPMGTTIVTRPYNRARHALGIPFGPNWARMGTTESHLPHIVTLNSTVMPICDAVPPRTCPRARARTRP